MTDLFASAHPASPAATPHVMIVDDQPTNLRVLADLLMTYGFEVSIARNGESALERLHYFQPDIILLDVMMPPGMDGFETCQQLKATPNLRDIPVIFMTALTDPVDKIKGLTLGAIDYITKPFNHNEVMARVNIHLHIRSLNRQVHEQNTLLREEIRSRTLAESALRLSEEKFSKAFRGCPSAMMMIRLTDQIIVEANQKCCQIFGYELCDFLGQPLSALSVWGDPAELDQTLTFLAQGGTVSDQMLPIDRPDRSIRHVHLSADVVDIGGIPHILIIANDQTDRYENTQALQETRDNYRRQAELYRLQSDLTQHMRQSLQLTDILTAVVQGVRQILNTDRVVVYRFTPAWDGQVMAESVRDPIAPLLGRTIADTCFINGWHHSYLTGRFSAISDIHTTTLNPCHRDLLASLDVRANLVVPIIHENVLWGLLIAHECNAPRQWQDWEIEFLQELTNRLALAVQQAELFTTVQQLNQNLESKIHARTQELASALRLEALLIRIIEKVRSSLDEELILQTAVEELAEGLDTWSCDTAIFVEGSQQFVITHECVRSGVQPALGTVITVNPTYKQVLSGQTLQYCPLFRPLRLDSPATICLAPIADEQGVWGDLCLYVAPQRSFSEAEIRLIQQVAAQCAIGMRQARLYRATQEQVTTLERLNTLKEDFVATVSHELRTPLTTVRMALHMMEKISDLDRKQHYLQIAVDHCQQEIRLVDDLLDLQRLEAGRFTFQSHPIPIPVWLPQVVDSIRLRAEDKQLHLDTVIDTACTLTSDPNSLERIIRELLANACKYSPPASRIEIRATSTDTALQITISNSAHIEAAEIPLLFNKFHRVTGSDRWKHGGTGLGLSLVKQLVERLQGRIWVTSYDQWTTFHLSLPLPQAS